MTTLPVTLSIALALSGPSTALVVHKTPSSELGVRIFQVDRYAPATAEQAQVVSRLDDDGLLKYREDRPLWGHSTYEFIKLRIPRETSTDTVIQELNSATSDRVGDVPESPPSQFRVGNSYVMAWELGEGATIEHPWGADKTVDQRLLQPSRLGQEPEHGEEAPGRAVAAYNLVRGSCMGGVARGTHGTSPIQVPCAELETGSVRFQPRGTGGISIEMGSNGKCVSIPSGVARLEGSPASFSECDDSNPGQTFMGEPFEPGSGYLMLRNEASALCLAANGSPRPGMPLVFSDCEPGLWRTYWSVADAKSAQFWESSKYSQILTYIYGEMKDNAKTLQRLRVGESLFPERTISAMLLFANNVPSGHEWDHKPKIFDKFQTYRTPVPGTDTNLFYDVWSNIHYGYVGRYAGFGEQELIDGSHGKLHGIKVGGAGRTDEDDDASVRLGSWLMDRYGEDLTESDLDRAIRDTVSAWDESEGNATLPLVSP